MYTIEEQQKLISNYDIFVDWDLNLDKSLIVFILNPKELMGKDNLEKVELGYDIGVGVE